ncbi:MAG: isoamylase early set domain-containing protein [Candidatus Omnitrophota bacterium]
MAKTQTKTATVVKSSAKTTTFKLIAPYANSVSVAGDFNNWDTSNHSMKKDWKNDWTLDIRLKPGRYEYKFYVDGAWQNDPNCDICVPNQFGSANCVIEVK